MGNQYSITVSDYTDSILQEMKDNGYKVSQVIDEAIKTLHVRALQRLIAQRRMLQSMQGDEE